MWYDNVGFMRRYRFYKYCVSYGENFATKSNSASACAYLGVAHWLAADDILGYHGIT